VDFVVLLPAVAWPTVLPTVLQAVAAAEQGRRWIVRWGLGHSDFGQTDFAQTELGVRVRAMERQVIAKSELVVVLIRARQVAMVPAVGQGRGARRLVVSSSMDFR